MYDLFQLFIFTDAYQMYVRTEHLVTHCAALSFYRTRKINIQPTKNANQTAVKRSLLGIARDSEQEAWIGFCCVFPLWHFLEISIVLLVHPSRVSNRLLQEGSEKDTKGWDGWVVTLRKQDFQKPHEDLEISSDNSNWM